MPRILLIMAVDVAWVVAVVGVALMEVERVLSIVAIEIAIKVE